MSRDKRQDRAHIELIRHERLDTGNCMAGCGPWSMTHVAAMVSAAVAEVIAKEFEDEAQRWEKLGEARLAAEARTSAVMVQGGGLS